MYRMYYVAEMNVEIENESEFAALDVEVAEELECEEKMVDEDITIPKYKYLVLYLDFRLSA